MVSRTRRAHSEKICCFIVAAAASASLLSRVKESWRKSSLEEEKIDAASLSFLPEYCVKLFHVFTAVSDYRRRG